MAFDFGALVAGFSTGAAESIESRNKQIRNGATRELDQLVQEATAKEKNLRTERDILTEQAKQLSTFVNAQGVGFTKTQILGLIQQPPVAKKLIEDLNNKKDLRDVDFASIFKVTQPGTEMDPKEFAVKKTSIPVGQETGKPTPVVRGAFGFESQGVAQAEREFQAVSGRTAAEVRGIARGRVDMGADFKPTEGTIDLSQFGNPESITNIRGQIRDNMARDIPLTDPKNASLLKQLQANAIIEAKFDKKSDGEADKPRTTSQINSVFSRSLAVAVDPFVVKGVVRLVPETGDYVPIGGSVEDIAAFQKQKNDTIKAQAEAIGILDKKGNIIGGRNASDALIPYANIEDNKVVSFKTIGKPAEIAPKVGGGTAPVVSQEPIQVPANAIVNGKIDPSKMVLGQPYIENGKVRTWIGGKARWQQ